MRTEHAMGQSTDDAIGYESARAQLIEMTNGTFAPWLERLNAKRATKPELDLRMAVDVWIIVSRLVVEHFDRGHHLNRKEVKGLLGLSSATDRRRLEVCDELGLLETYTPENLTVGDKPDQRPSYCRPTQEAVDLIDSQCREWAIRFGKLQPGLVEYYGLEKSAWSGAEVPDTEKEGLGGMADFWSKVKRAAVTGEGGESGTGASRPQEDEAGTG